MRRLLPALVLLATPALAAGPDTVTVIPGGQPGTNVGPEGVPYLMAPMNDASGKLHGYAYLSIRLTASSPAVAEKDIREKLAFIQDAWVHDVNAAPVAAADDPAKVDIAKVEARLTADARRIVGTAQIAMLTVCTVQISDLHSKQTPTQAGSTDDAALKMIPKSRCEPEKLAKPAAK
jgi:hypothetical protein